MILQLLFGATLAAGPTSDQPQGCRADCILEAQPVQSLITVDGFLDEEDWLVAPIATDFIQFSPNEGAMATQRTEVRVLYGSTALFIGATLYDTSSEDILRTLGRRDEFNQADWFMAAIDSYYDRKTAYNFAVNAAGIQADGIYSGRSFRGGEGGFGFETSWDAVWDAMTRVTSEGWVVEMKIPYSMLRFSDANIQRWGINFRRVIPRLSETDEWVMVPRAERSSGTVAQFGTLEGLVNINRRRNLQVTPYSVSRLLTEEAEAQGQLDRQTSLDVGGDIKVGLSSNVTLDASLNPDFGQVDADPAELNLSAFETFFPERRPFFTEGTQIFRYDLDHGGSLLYTRRIGAIAPIIGAAKLSGRTDSGLSFGFFGAATGDKFQPGNYYGVGRMQRQIGNISNVGGMVTFFDHSGIGARRSFAGGLDWDLRFRNNKYKFDGQISSAHRAQPGADLDAERGFAMTAGFDRQRSDWNIFSGITIISDQFNPNDVGRLRRNNYVNLNGGFSHQINGGEPFGPFRRGSALVFSGQGISYKEGLSTGFGVFLRSDWVTHGFQEIDLGFRTDYLLGGYDVTETRGLGPRARPRELNVELSVTSDTRRKWRLQPDIEINFFGDGGRAYQPSLEMEWTVSTRVSLSAEVGLGLERGTVEWASNESFSPTKDGWAIGESSRSAPDAVENFLPFDHSAAIGAILAIRNPYDDLGRHYLPVYGERDTRSTDFTLRSDVTLTRTLSIQFYGQLFAARGEYGDISLLRDRDTLVPVENFPKQYDFSVNSFQTNTVLRWEYRPGSTLFVVWSQSRRGDDGLGPFDLTSQSPFDQRSVDQLLDTFDLFPTNIFLIKLSYTFLR